MNVLIQQNTKQYDFVLELLNQIDLEIWCREHCVHNCIFIDKYDPNYLLNFKDHLPMGSIDFVHTYMDKFFNYHPKPINIPDQLNDIEFLNRKIRIDQKSNIAIGEFIKEKDKVKGLCGIVDPYLYHSMENNKDYLVSDPIDISSEYRCFVYRNQLVGMKHYIGDFTEFPNISKIKEMINVWTDSPIAYTMDIGIRYGNTILIECHNFYSCGLYGWSSNLYLPMVIDWWIEFKKKIPIENINQIENH